jgi:hypothetical protein
MRLRASASRGRGSPSQHARVVASASGRRSRVQLSNGGRDGRLVWLPCEVGQSSPGLWFLGCVASAARRRVCHGFGRDARVQRRRSCWPRTVPLGGWWAEGEFRIRHSSLGLLELRVTTGCRRVTLEGFAPCWCGVLLFHQRLVTSPSGLVNSCGGSRRRPLPRLPSLLSRAFIAPRGVSA